MPAEAEARLWAEAKRKFPNDPERQRAYVYGALRNMGWKPRKEK